MFREKERQVVLFFIPLDVSSSDLHESESLGVVRNERKASEQGKARKISPFICFLVAATAAANLKSEREKQQGWENR